MPRTAANSRATSPSDHAQFAPMSKRDKRRNTMHDRLNDMDAAFAKDQHQHYRAQLQALQVDMTLILRADPYENMPLDDTPEAIADMIETVTARLNPLSPAGRDDFLAMAGKRYFQYTQKINQAMEQRDADLTALKNRYDSANAQLRNSTAYKMALANAEHRELAATIRRRLINTVTRKRDRLLKEKEQLNIADSNALSFMPSHFSINAPASPGGMYASRKTRNTRQRPLEDTADTSGIERGRKRKAPFEDREPANSPAPPLFRPATGDTVPDRVPTPETRSKQLLFSQFEAPVYSIDQLFTDKELLLASNTAQIAARDILLQHRMPESAATTSSGVLDNGENAAVIAAAATTAPAPIIETSDNPAADIAAAADAAQSNGTAADAELPQTKAIAQIAAASDMERSQSQHATRGATKANPLSFLSDAAAAISPNQLILANPFIPNIIPITKTDRGAPTPPAMSGTDVTSDMALMFAADTAVPTPAVNPEESNPTDEKSAETLITTPQPQDIHMLRTKYLDQACREPSVTQPFRLSLNDLGPAAVRPGISRPAYLGFADPASLPNGQRNGSAVPLIRSSSQTRQQAVPVAVGADDQASTSGPAAFAGLASSAGGVGMSRTTSAAGSDIGAAAAVATASDVVGNGVRRTRTRLI